MVWTATLLLKTFSTGEAITPVARLRIYEIKNSRHPQLTESWSGSSSSSDSHFRKSYLRSRDSTVSHNKLKTHPAASAILMHHYICRNAKRTCLSCGSLPPRDTTTPEFGRVEIVFTSVYRRQFRVVVVHNNTRNALGVARRLCCFVIKETLAVQKLALETIVLTKAVRDREKDERASELRVVKRRGF